ncbi:helix-turn-helix domain-containing protein [Bacillus sp. EB600]|uniref:helix-turn-helix domain-containing protein n=1 Tax=Bacillus sp. EB600 TaxID=2806345 RepID=UPI002109C329|nr:helix-turn-helix transcriptional regulator [Bacillus sp. EB600]
MKDKESIFIGNVIIRLRRAKPMNQEELAFQSGLDRSSMSKIETNKSEPSLWTIFSLANALGMKPSELVKEIEENVDFDFCPEGDQNFKPKK